jgi:hypothetical protein
MEYEVEKYNKKIEIEPYNTLVQISEIMAAIEIAEEKLGCKLVSIKRNGDNAGLELKKATEKFDEFDVNKKETDFAGYLLVYAMQRIIHLSPEQRQAFYEAAKKVLHIDINSFKIIEEIAIDN